MQSGRILPVFRQFFSTATKAGQSHRDSDSQGQSSPERDASEEEARRAMELLSESEEFKKNQISVGLELQGGRPTLVVRDRAGLTLRVLQGPEILRLLQSMGSPQAPRQGRILDRRI